MLQHQAKCSQLLGVGEPGAILHPGWIGRALAADHQEHWTPGLVEGFIDKVPLGAGQRETHTVDIWGQVCISVPGCTFKVQGKGQV